ncbi:neutral alpha-glucosidase AB [Chlorella sorokiniana]|uniref:Neutral alpha-glucosidase AB n=1 Tax=Chlorella sorokiniana TaxID=3076 RepID=A0A2P6TUC4_CHLSO|nr:neutral alpha-glucosidase AB [Chlorella sorokiniana]|eukprot:PRW57678.1 neutral alpha-glucosidase AB [Chlorella sorokiniana]
MLARRAASALAAAAIARPAAACLAVLESFNGSVCASISPAAFPSGGQAAAHRLPPTGPGSSGGLHCGPGGALQSSAAERLALLRSFISSSSSSQAQRQHSKSSGGSSSSSVDRSGLSDLQLQAAAERLMRCSRNSLMQSHKPRSTDKSMQQRMALLLRLGFSQAAIETAIQRQNGGPYVAEQHIGKAREFGLQRSEVATACGHSTILLEYKQASLAANWQAFVEEFQPSESAVRKLAAALRQGEAAFLQLTMDMLRHKVAQLQALLGLDSSGTSRYVGHLAALFRSDVDQTARPRFELLQQLTGRPAASLAPIILRYPQLLRYPEATLQRNFAAVLAAMGPADGRLVVWKRPDILKAAEGRVAANLLSLQHLRQQRPG